MFGRCESSPCVFEFNGNFLQGARCKMREGRQRTLTEGLSAFAPLRGRREVVERRACSGRRIESREPGA